MSLKKPLLFLAVHTLITIPGFSFGEEVPQYVNVPSSYADEPLVLDGYDNDWKDNHEGAPTIFKGASLSLPSINEINSLSGEILIRNNETHLALFIKMNTLYPIRNESRSVYLSFDENGDGVLSSGDNALIVTNEGSFPKSVLDLYVTEEGIVNPDPPKDSKMFQAFLRYVSNSEIAIEILVPFKDTNDFYDLAMGTPQQFDIILAYIAGQSGVADSSSFGAKFTYLLEQSPQTALVPSIQVFSIYAFTAIISLVIVAIFTRKKISLKPAFLTVSSSKQLSIVVLLVLFASVAIVVLNPLVIEDTTSNLRLLSNSIVNQNFIVIMIYAIVLGMLPAFFALSLFKQSENLVSGLVFDQKFLLRAPIVVLVILLIQIVATPVLYIINSVPYFTESSQLAENIRPHVFLLQPIIGVGTSGIVVLVVFYCFSIWIPSAFLIFTLYDVRTSHQRSRTKIALICISSILFIIIALWSVFGLFVASPDKLGYISILLGPTIAAVLLSFLAAEGYIDTIRESFNKIRDISLFSKKQLDKSVPRKSMNIFKRIGIKLGAMFVLTISVIGLSKNLFLLTIPFVSINFPLGLSPINEIFINVVSRYAITISSGQSFEAASVVYNSFIVFFSLFWLYDIIMILRGLGKEFLNSENLLYKTLKTHIGSLTAISFLSLIILFTINNQFLDFRVNEMNAAMPTWVKREIGIQTGEIQILSDLFSQFGFFTGIATFLGVIYVMIRSKSVVKKSIIAVLKIDSK